MVCLLTQAWKPSGFLSPRGRHVYRPSTVRWMRIFQIHVSTNVPAPCGRIAHRMQLCSHGKLRPSSRVPHIAWSKTACLPKLRLCKSADTHSFVVRPAQTFQPLSGGK